MIVIKIEFNPYGIICTDLTDIYDVHFIIIDESDKTIDVCDESGFSIAQIYYNKAEEIVCFEYSSDEELQKEERILVKNGELVINNI